jgi:hypothetical protein
MPPERTPRKMKKMTTRPWTARRIQSVVVI